MSTTGCPESVSFSAQVLRKYRLHQFFQWNKPGRAGQGGERPPRGAGKRKGAKDTVPPCETRGHPGGLDRQGLQGLDVHPGEFFAVRRDTNNRLLPLGMEQDLLSFPLLQSIAEATRMNTQDLTDILDREIPVRVCGVDPFFSLLKEATLMRFAGQEIGLETVDGIL